MKRLLQRHFIPYWKTWVVLLTPLLLLPLPISVEGPEARAGYGVLVITIYWLTACLPLAVTSLLPIVIFPLVDVLSTSEVCSAYFKEANVVFLGGLILALGVEQSKLHRRIALRVILIVGTDPRWLMLGFMLVGMLLSMWITNSGVTAMLIPIVEAVVDELFQENSGTKEDCDLESGISIASTITSSSRNGSLNISANVIQEKEHNSECDNSKLKDRIRTPMILSISYSASIGGAGTLIGSGSPLAFKGILEELYGPDTGLSFATFMAVAVPIALANTLLTWIWLQILFMGPCWTKKSMSGLRSSQEIKASIRKQYEELGSASFYEKSIMALFTMLIVLWMFKDPQFMPGWEDLFPYEHRIGDATVAVGVLVLAFIIPSKPRFWCFATSDDENPRSSPSLLEWKYVQQKFPWNILLLLGGGYVISDAFKASGLSYWLGHKLSIIQYFPPVAICILMCLIATALTEVASNTATASILLPIVAQMGEVSKMNPLYLMIPVAITCCYAFMLPVGTPSNAQVLSTGKKKLKPSDMVKAGAVMNIFTILVICAINETIGTLVFDLHSYPDWADAQ